MHVLDGVQRFSDPNGKGNFEEAIGNGLHDVGTLQAYCAECTAY